ncbi:MAG: DNA gyrase subunit A [Acidobacteriota bacterium]
MENNPKELAVNIEEEMKASYLDYAMSVIIGRALPDVRDGLKPVHRRVLFAMQELNNVHNKPHKKSARVVGEVIGKYHPHGETAVYDTIVRMAQEFSMREPLIDGQGNFGSIDGDSAAAMRYTEVRMSRLAEQLLADIDKDTVEFQPNYDESLREPLVLPTRVPNLLLNGASGIAVGMATNIPPHNLGETIDALLLLLENPRAGLRELIEVMPGPDFPTAGFIHGRHGIAQAYATGRGVIHLRAKTSFEENGRDRIAIIVEELPYQVNKAKLIERIAQLVHDKRIEGISDLRDESSREGMRIVIELKRDATEEIVLNHLFKLTPMQTSFGINLLAIADGQPRVLSLREILALFLEHRKDVVRRRTAFELDKAEQRAHILEGLRKALDYLDEIISLIRASASPAEARSGLIAQFDFSDAQAQAILDMRLQRLTALERDKIIGEYQNILKEIARLREILSDERALRAVIHGELVEIRENFSSPRRTIIVDEQAELTIEDLIVEEQVIITATRNGYIKRTSLDVYRSQARGGKGRRGMSTASAEDLIQYLFTASTHSYLLIFTRKGQAYWVKVYAVPNVGAAGRGKPIVNLINIEKDDQVADIIAVDDFSADEYVMTTSRLGYVKKTPLAAFSNPRTVGIIACGVAEDDELLKVERTSGSDHILLATRNGKAIRFSENGVRSMGRTARGVKGLTLRPGDALVAMCVLRDDSGDILSVTEKGYGKRTPLTEYRVQGRGGYGIINIKTGDRTGQVAGVSHVIGPDDLLLVTEKGKIIRQPVEQIRQTASRSTQGVRLIDLGEDDRVSDIGLVAPEEEDDDQRPEED